VPLVTLIALVLLHVPFEGGGRPRAHGQRLIVHVIPSAFHTPFVAALHVEVTSAAIAGNAQNADTLATRAETARRPKWQNDLASGARTLLGAGSEGACWLTTR
jgi:hypothetical protein